MLSAYRKRENAASDAIDALDKSADHI